MDRGASAPHTIYNLLQEDKMGYMTRPSGKLATIGDILKDRDQTILTAKVMGMNTNFVEHAFTQLIKDLDPSRQHPYSLFSYGWELPIHTFQSLAPLFKSRLRGATHNNFRTLLCQERNRIVHLRREKNRRTFRRPNGYRPPMPLACETTVKGRLFPLKDYRKIARKILRRLCPYEYIDVSYGHPYLSSGIHMSIESGRIVYKLADLVIPKEVLRLITDYGSYDREIKKLKGEI